MDIERVTVIRSGAQWQRLIERGLQRIDDELSRTGGDATDALTCWRADPAAFADVVHGLVALRFPVPRECLVLAGMATPQPWVGRDDDLR